MTWYLAGPITNDPAWQDKFDRAARRLRESGLQVVSPLDLSKPQGGWTENMRRCIRALTECDGIILLEGWDDSKGARLEKEIAEGLGMTVVRFANLFPKEIAEISKVS